MLGATDKQRSLFLKGFKLSKQGQYEDPTYLGFKIVFDFGTLPIDAEDLLPPSPLLKSKNYESGGASSNSFGPGNPFGQPQYDFRSNSNILFYSAEQYLAQRESDFINGTGGNRADMLRQFKISLNDLLTNSPWFIQSITGLDKLSLVSRPGYQPSPKDEGFSSHRTKDKFLDFTTLESLNLRMTALAELYNKATFDYDNMRELLPRNLRKFTMYIFVSEIRNFFKTSRLVGSSASLQALDNLSNLLGNGNNPGSNLGLVTDADQKMNGSSSNNGISSSIGPGGKFNSFVGNVLNQAGLNTNIMGQQEQSGIKPVIIFECKNCEFDFTESTPIPQTINTGTDAAVPVTQKFRIYVGKVRTRTQLPNIRQDGNPLVLTDGWDSVRSSVQKNPNDTNDILSLGGQLLTNFLSNSLNDLINEGIASYVKPAVAGLDTLVMGNIYSLNPSQVLGNLSFNSAQQYLDQLGNINAGFNKTILPNPQTLGKGGPPQRVYPAPGGDVYNAVPGKDLGVPGRVYPAPGGDVYADVPGKDLGVPNRVYPAPGGDVYADVPGKDLGVPNRVYPAPGGDVYADVPGKDLGVPNRVYPAPGGDVYADVPGKDLGVPNRVYPAPGGDVYADVPGKDLGVPNRVYPAPGGDVYADVPGKDLGVPNRVYPSPGGDVYADVPGKDLGVPNRVYPAPGGDVYADVPGNDLGVPNRVYPAPGGDVYADVPGKDLGVPNRVYPAPGGDVYGNVPGNDLGVPNRVYPAPGGDVYGNVPGNDLGVPNRVYPSPGGDVYGNVPGKDLGVPGRDYQTPPLGDVYGNVPGRDLGVPDRKYGSINERVYPRTSGDFIMEKPKDLGNLKPSSRYNISIDGKNPTDEKFE